MTPTVKTQTATAPTEKLTERQQQQRVVKWAAEHEAEFPELKLLYHVPNEGKRGAITGRQLKLSGVKSGVPDLCLPVARHNFHGLYIEMKTKGGRVSENQKQWMSDLSAQGYECQVCYSWTYAVEVLQTYLSQE